MYYLAMHALGLQLHTPPEVLRRLADRIRALRLSRAWKQSTLAQRAGVSLPTVQRYERTGRASVETLLRLCHALGRLDELAAVLEPAPASSLAEFEARDHARKGPTRRRGSR
jgi:transcriptional regulator with XRE-family HTH domain